MRDKPQNWAALTHPVSSNLSWGNLAESPWSCTKGTVRFNDRVFMRSRDKVQEFPVPKTLQQEFSITYYQERGRGKSHEYSLASSPLLRAHLVCQVLLLFINRCCLCCLLPESHDCILSLCEEKNLWTALSGDIMTAETVACWLLSLENEDSHELWVVTHLQPCPYWLSNEACVRSAPGASQLLHLQHLVQNRSAGPLTQKLRIWRQWE